MYNCDCYLHSGLFADGNNGIRIYVIARNSRDWRLGHDNNSTWKIWDRLFKQNIGLSGKFMPILKENWNAENLNF